MKNTYLRHACLQHSTSHHTFCPRPDRRDSSSQFIQHQDGVDIPSIASVVVIEATVKRFFYDTHEQLKPHLSDFIAAYNFARRLKTFRGLTPYKAIYKLWIHAPNRFTLDPIHQMPGLNT
jgi:hypothetical protein